MADQILARDGIKSSSMQSGEDTVTLLQPITSLTASHYPFIFVHKIFVCNLRHFFTRSPVTGLFFLIFEMCSQEFLVHIFHLQNKYSLWQGCVDKETIDRYLFICVVAFVLSTSPACVKYFIVVNYKILTTQWLSGITTQAVNFSECKRVTP